MSTRQISHALIVFGGGIADMALATDFVMLAKKFKADGLDPTCLSAINILDTIEMSGPLLFGRDDLGRRIEIYTKEEAKRPFYRIIRQGLKEEVARWIRRVSANLQTGDRLAIIFVAHGHRWNHGVILSGESLTKAEMRAALSVVPSGVRILIINEACFSGMWTDLATELGTKNDIVVETASRVKEKSYSYRSASDKYRCTLFGAAFVHEIGTYPEGRISQHYARIKSEMEHVSPDQDTSTPLVDCSQRTLRFHNISHFVLTPSIATAIANAASSQTNHQETLTARERARRFWRKLCRDQAGPGGANSGGTSCDGTDEPQLATIKEYIFKVGRAAAELNRTTLICACQAVLDGRGGANLKDRVLKTIAWQSLQMLRVEKLLSHLLARGLISCLISPEDAQKAVESSDSWQISQSLGTMLLQNQEIQQICGPAYQDGYIDVIFDDAMEWLVFTLLVNFLLCPECFDFEKIQSCTVRYFQGCKRIQ